MSQDITDILDKWDFERHELNVRVITGKDGLPKIQMRTELGLIQMNMDGRPDGKRPFKRTSILEHFTKEAAEFGNGYKLNDDVLEELFYEGWQYYQRYLCLFQLGYYDLVVRDTDRNLQLAEFVRTHTKKRKIAWRFDQYRPYIIMMNTRAKATLLLQEDDRDTAIDCIETGRKEIISFLQDYGQDPDQVECFELDFLSRWLEELYASKVEPFDEEESDISLNISDLLAGIIDENDQIIGEALSDGVAIDGVDELAILKNSLANAVEAEEYEKAAQIRDQIRRFENKGPSDA